MQRPYSIRCHPRAPEYRAGLRAAYALARSLGVRRRNVRRILRAVGPVRDWATVRAAIVRIGGEW